MLRDHLYNKDKEGAWQLDVDIECVRQVNEQPDSANKDANQLDVIESDEEVLSTSSDSENGDTSESELSESDDSNSDNEESNADS